MNEELATNNNLHFEIQYNRNYRDTLPKWEEKNFFRPYSPYNSQTGTFSNPTVVKSFFPSIFFCNTIKLDYLQLLRNIVFFYSSFSKCATDLLVKLINFRKKIFFQVSKPLFFFVFVHTRGFAIVFFSLIPRAFFEYTHIRTSSRKKSNQRERKKKKGQESLLKSK